MASELIEYYNTGHDDDDYFGGPNLEYAQVFTAESSHTITSVKLLLARAFTPSTITVSIRATSSSKPTGADLCSETFDGDTLPSGGGNAIWKEIVFSSPISVVNNTKYAIVVKSSDTYFLWRHDDSSPTYTGGTYCYSSNNGSSWTSVSGTDLMFEVWGESSLPPKVETTSPEHEDSDIALHETTVTWESPGENVDSYNVYYGTLSGFLSLLGSVDAEDDLEYTVVDGNFPLYGEIYYFRIDSVNEYGTTQGDEIAFTTIVFKTPSSGGRGGYSEGEAGSVGDGDMNIKTRLVAFARNKVFYEDT